MQLQTIQTIQTIQTTSFATIAMCEHKVCDFDTGYSLNTDGLDGLDGLVGLGRVCSR